MYVIEAHSDDRNAILAEIDLDGALFVEKTTPLEQCCDLVAGALQTLFIQAEVTVRLRVPGKAEWSETYAPGRKTPEYAKAS